MLMIYDAPSDFTPFLLVRYKKVFLKYNPEFRMLKIK